MPTLLVAAGGGGDAITSCALVGPLGLDERPTVMTYSWDRLLVDPLPGPRTAQDFAGLRQVGTHLFEVLATTQPIAPAGSSLPRLAGELPARLLLLDPTGGADGLTAQIRAAANMIAATSIVLLDVGGDVLTDGTDAGLRSPLADQLALAACVRSGFPTRLIIAAPGLDGEIPAPTITARFAQLDGDYLPRLTPSDVGPVRHVFTWHPSEASGLLAAAAAGRRGRVEVRDAGDQVALTDETTALLSIDAQRAAAVTPARLLVDSCSLQHAEHVIREATGISEIEYETHKAARLDRRQHHRPEPADLAAIDQRAVEARERGADFISVRRLAELLDATSLDTFASLTDLLLTYRAAAYEPSIFSTDPQL